MDSPHDISSASGDAAGSRLPAAVELKLAVTDPELVAELVRFPDGPPRLRFAANALRIGILSLKQAEGRIDVETIRHEAEHLLGELSRFLDEHQEEVSRRISTSLKEYFDPESGRFTERVNRLVADDGELASFMAGQIGEENSRLASTLASHVGATSPIMQLLSPDNTEGFLETLGGKIDEQLSSSRKTILDEFSLDKEQSALSQLVKRVEKSQGSIADEFSLDNEASALSRMKRELERVLKDHRQESLTFRSEVLEKLAAVVSRREEAQRSTRHGGEFEDQVREFCALECQKRGDILEDKSNAPGVIKNCKVGDLVIQLGPDSAAAGARITIEVKESASYTLRKALDELDTARKNRAASVGVFVCSAATRPENQPPLARYGCDIVVVWDKDEPTTDVYLEAALTIARAISTQRASGASEQVVDFEPIEKAIRGLEKLTKGLEEIDTLSKTIYNNSHKIQNRVRLMRGELTRQIATLDTQMEILGSAIGSSED